MSPGPDVPTDVEELLASRGHSGVGPAAKLVAALEPPRILWANREAKALFGTADVRSLTRFIFGPAVQARPLSIRLGRLECGEPARLERLLVTDRFRRFAVTLACGAVLGRPQKIVLMQTLPGEMPASASGSPAEPEPPERATTEPPPKAAVAMPSPPEPADTAPYAAALDPPTAAGRVQSRFLWRTDRAGAVTHVGSEMAAYLGDAALQIDDDLHARLRALPCDEATIAADALAARRSWPPLPLAWPTEDARQTIIVTFGGTPEPGRAGFRGFGLLQGQPPLQQADRASEDRRPVPDAEATTAPAVEDLSAPMATIEPDVQIFVADARVLAESAESRSGDGGSDRRPDAVAASLASVAAPEAHSAPVSNAHDRPALAIGRPQPAPKAVETIPPPRPERVVPLPGFPASGTAKVVQLSTFKTGAPALSGRATALGGPPKLPDSEPTPEPLDAPRWAEAPGPAAAPDQRLSSHERFNFDEIARALAALPAVEAAGLGRAQRSEPAPPVPARGPERSDADAWSLLDAVSVGLLVTQAEAAVYANRNLLDVLGYGRIGELAEAGRLGRLFGGPSKGPPGTGGQSFTLIARDGARVEVDARVQKIVWQGAPASLMSVRRSGEEDARARLGATALDLHRSQALASDLAQALDLACSGSGFLDPRGRILSLTHGAERLFGYDQREIVGDTCTMLFAVENQASWSEFYDSFAAAAGRTSAYGRFAGRNRTGSTLSLGVGLRRINLEKICIVWQENAHGHAAQSELDVLRREAERASALKSEFLAKVSHEIRTPLNAILGFSELMVEERFGPLGNERYREYLRDIQTSGTHVLSLINDLLDLSRIEAGGLSVDLGPVNVNIVLGECVASLQGQAHRDRIIIRTSFGTPSPVALVDERALRQIALNLLSNAVKFTEPGGQVIVSTGLSDMGQVVVRVRDTGHGMSDDEIETALKPFRQLPSNRANAGTGLGLTLAKAMVEASQGNLKIKSKRGEGTLVEITLQQGPSASPD